MAAKVFRADYDQLTQAAAMFGQQADQARGALQRLGQDLDRLQGGDWRGQGARAFYGEMNGQVLPSLNRLVRALDQAAATTRAINQVAQEAEREAAACLQANGNGSGPGSAPGAPIAAAAAGLGLDSAGASGSPVGAGASSFVGRADANGGGSPGPAAKPKAPLKAPVAPAVKGDGDKQGQAAYLQYLIDYTKYLRQQSQSWDWQTVKQKVDAQEKANVQLAKNVGKELRAAFRAYEKNPSDPALRQKVLDVIRQQENLISKAQSDLLVLGDRAHELMLQAEKSMRQDKVVTQAEQDRFGDMLETDRHIQKSTELNNEMVQMLKSMRKHLNDDH